MSPYFSKTVRGSFEAVVAAVRAALAAEGFGVITEIDVQATLKAKIDVDFHPYLILGACSPEMAYAVLQVDETAGTLLPCNVVVRVLPSGEVDVTILDPVAAMQVMGNPDLVKMASAVSRRLHKVIDGLTDLADAA